MSEILKNKKIILVCIILIIIFYVIFFNIDKNNDDNNEYFEEKYQYLEKYESNQFVPIKITEADMATKYLNDYKNLLLTNIDDAYKILNNEYKEKKFKNIERFKEYISLLKSTEFYKMTVSEYSVFSKNGYKFYYIITSSEDKYIFKEISIMNYEVYLDDYTVELK